MSYAVAKNTCNSCHAKTKVYFPDGLSLKGGHVYRYLCPGCGTIVYCRPDAGTVRLVRTNRFQRMRRLRRGKSFSDA